MNLKKLFETQKALDEAIVKKKGLEGQDLLPQKILALQVELGECANEWREFKFWSKNREPRIKKTNECPTCIGTGDANAEVNVEMLMEGKDAHDWEDCEDCNATGLLADTNPLLEEYVDCLHFILSIGLEYQMEEAFDEEVNFNIGSRTKKSDALGTFDYIFKELADFYSEGDFIELLSLFFTLGDSLGFTEQQIEQAYFDKNKINHQRQENGY